MSQAKPPSYRVRIAPTSDGGGDRIPDLTPREALERWLDKLRVDKRDSTVSSYHYRLKHFGEWCEDEGIDSIGDVTGWDLETYETTRRSEGLKTISLNNELGTLENFLEYCARVELVDDSLPEKVQPPTVDREDEVDETKLAPEAAKLLLEYYRATPAVRHSREHVLLELIWYTGARVGGIRALDIEDYYPDDQYVDFNHRPESETPLKNGVGGERAVPLNDDVCDAVDGYREHTRAEKFDDHGRRPLLTTERGRPVDNTLRDWMYRTTFPCHYQECPHGKDPDTCEYKAHGKASQCPSSRSPHQVRTGAVTWMLNRGVPLETVARWVNASPETIKRHYDKPDMEDEMEKRLRPHLDRLSLDDDDESDSNGGAGQ